MLVFDLTAIVATTRIATQNLTARSCNLNEDLREEIPQEFVFDGECATIDFNLKNTAPLRRCRYMRFF